MKIRKIITVFLLCALAAPQVLAQEVDTHAEQRAALKAEISEGGLAECRSTLGKAFDFETEIFFVFLQGHFQNKSSNTSLTNTAISRYAELKTRMEEYFSALINTTGDSDDRSFSEELAALDNCTAIRDTYIASAKQQMIEHIRNNSAQKRTTVMLDKYKSINSQLRELNLNMAKMYGFFATFKDKLPAFTKYCRKSFG